MKKGLRTVCSVALIGAFAFASIASGSSSKTDETRQLVDSTAAQDESSDGSRSGDDTVSSSDSNDFTIEEQVLVDENGLKITATGMTDDSIWGQGISLLIENSSDTDYGVGCDALIVNDYMITDLFSSQITAGMNANETMYLSSTELDAAGIDKIGKIEIDFRIYDTSTYMTVFDPDTVTIETSLYNEMDTEPDDSGIELYNANDIRIIGKYVDENSFWGAGILLYIENNSDVNITVQCESIAVNGFMVDGLLSCEVYSDRRAIDDITLFSSDLEDNGITSIDDISLSFRIFNPDTYDQIDTTEQITFSAAA